MIGIPYLCKPPLSHIGQKRVFVEHMLFVLFGNPEVVGMDIRVQYGSSDQAIAAKPIDGLKVFALQFQVGLFQEKGIYFNSPVGGQGIDNLVRFGDPRLPWGSGQGSDQCLIRHGKTNREFTMLLNVVVGSMGRGTDKTDIVLKAHGGDHVFWGQVIPLRLPCPNHGKGGNHKEVTPDGLIRIEGQPLPGH